MGGCVDNVSREYFEPFDLLLLLFWVLLTLRVRLAVAIFHSNLTLLAPPPPGESAPTPQKFREDGTSNRVPVTRAKAHTAIGVGILLVKAQSYH